MTEIEKNSRPKKWRSQKNHILTKKYFNLYWLLEAISEGFEEISGDEFLIKNKVILLRLWYNITNSRRRTQSHD